ncbi:MAG TPA: serine/threonine-protein kinase, partial [Phycisphaerae bacterium]
VFEAACQRQGAARAVFLDQACRGDSELRREVDALLTFDKRAEDFIEQPVLGAVSGLLVEDSPGDLFAPGQHIGAYELVRAIGSGGMGTVYEALQRNPRRTVAVKVMRAGLGAASALRRFQEESQVLGRLRHPAIAQIYEAGTHSESALVIPFFAMEYVCQARTLTVYADAEQLSLRQRLELFVKVCEGVHHGHQKGVIHRDLKPANILVGDDGQPKIIDFGVARVLQPEGAPTLTRTGGRELVGTLQYMSPEQCAFDPAALDTRSDVYALGVVLFELLCGSLPYDVSTASFSNAARMIHEAAPRRLSALDRRLRGDLETITLKALEKVRERRYQSAADLGRDVERFLNNQPIEARPPSATYQLRKLVSRHRPLFAALTMLFVSVTVLAISMTVLYGRAELNRLRAEAAEHSTRAEAEKANQALSYLVSLFGSLDPAAASDADPMGNTVRVRELLDREARTIPERFKNLPLVQATLFNTLANAYGRLELFERAAAVSSSAYELRRAALGARHPVVAESLCDLGRFLQRKGEYVSAERACRAALDIRRELGTRARSYPLTISAVTGALASVLQTSGDLAGAEHLYREALALQPDTEWLRLALTHTLRLKGDYAEAERLARQFVDDARRRAGERSAPVGSALIELSLVLRDAGAYAAADSVCREALEIRQELGGTVDPDAAHTLVHLARLRSLRGDDGDALALYRRALDILRPHFGDEHSSVFSTRQGLAELLVATGDRASVDALYAEIAALEDSTRAQPPDSLQHSGWELLMGVLCLGRDDAVRAEALLHQCAEHRRQVLSPEHWLTAYAENMLGGALTALGHYEEAEPLLLHSYPRIRDTLGRNDDRTFRARRRIVDMYEAWGRPADASRYRIP